MADRSVSIRLGANVQGFVSGMRTAQKATEDFVGKGLDRVAAKSSAIDNLSNVAGIMGAGMVAAAGAAVVAFANFDQAMSNVAATGADARNNIDALTDAAIEAGASTAFSATEAANAVEELAKAGVSAADILNGGLDGALDLAAAGGLGVAEAAGIAATALQQFNLEGSDMSHVADLMAAAAGKAMGDVDDMGAALAQSGLVAAQTGLSIEETTGALAAFAQQGLLGSDAGTSLKTALQRLTPQSDAARQQFEDLGISAYDANGQFVGLAEFAGQLETAMADLSPEARNAAMQVMFGSDAVRAANVLYSEGEAGIREWISAVDDQGYAAETAATKLDNLRGDIEELGGAFETALIGAGEGADGPLRSLVQGATDVVNGFNELPDAVQQGTMAIVGAGGLVLLGVGGLGKLVTAAADVKQSFDTIGISAKTAGIAAAGITAGLTVVTVGVAAFAGAQAEARAKVEALSDTLDDQTGALTANSTAWIQSELTKDQNFGIGNMQSMAEAAEQMGVSLETLTRAYQGQPAAVREARAAAEEYLGQQNLVNDTLLQNSSVAQIFLDNLDDQAQRLEDAREVWAAQNEIALAAGETQGTLAERYGVSTEAAGGLTEATQELTEAQAAWRDEVAEADASFIGLMDGYQAVIDKNKEVAEETAAATESSEDSWESYYDGFSVGLDEYLTGLETMVAEQQAWETNMLLLSGRVSQGVLDELAKLGPEGAPLVADLVNASDEELARLETVYGQRSDDATQEFAGNLEAAGPVLGQIMHKHGTKAAEEAARALAAGETTLQNVINQYDLDIPVDADLTPAINTIAGWRPADKRITVWADTKQATPGPTGTMRGMGMATGGAVVGPGTGTSDSIPAWLSNGEYVIKADAVRQYGRSFFDAVNAQKFATGGPVAPVVNVTAPATSTGYSGPLVHVERVVQGTPKDVGAEVSWALIGKV